MNKENRLFRVRWQGVCYVWAPSEYRAEELAEELVADGVKGLGLESIGIWGSAEPDDLGPFVEDEDWENSYPFGEDPTDENRTVKQIRDAHKKDKE